MTSELSNPERLILALDSGLNHEVSLVLYGRASLSLGFEGAPMEFGATQDVDVIIPLIALDRMVNDGQFWDARDAVNEKFKDEGLYITHLFQEDQVFLRPDWEAHVVPVTRPATRWLKLARPHTVDLILTKMMRGDDAQDMQDVAFLVRRDGITAARMEPAFETVRIPDVIELHDAFQKALPVVRDILRRGGRPE